MHVRSLTTTVNKKNKSPFILAICCSVVKRNTFLRAHSSMTLMSY